MTTHAAMLFSGGEEPFSPKAELVDSTYHGRDPHDLNILITTDTGSVELSPETLSAIAIWVKNKLTL